MLSVVPTSTAHHFTTLSGREVFVVDGQAGFNLEALVAACHDASCRPPTAGGTGGSKPSAFGQRIRDAIAGEAVLADLTVKANAERHAALVTEQKVSNQEGFLRRIKIGTWTSILEIQPVGTADYSREAADHRVEVVRGVRRDAENLNHAQLADPNYVPHTDFERQFHELIQNRINNDRSLPETMLIDYDGLKVRVVFRGLSEHKPELDQTYVSADHEAASTRIGAIVRQEVLDRIAKYSPEEFTAKHQAIMQKLADIGGTTDFQVFPVGKTSRIQSSSITQEVRAEMAKVATEAGLRHGDLDTSLRLDRDRFAREQVIAVLKEARSIGGTIDGTPRHRAPKNGLSSNEQVTKAMELFPTDWINASNVHGKVNFRQTEGRAHYSHSKAEVTLNGAIDVAAHEMGHRFERTVPGLLAMEKHFMTRRAGPDPTFQHLNKLQPGSRYGKDEVALPDHFFDPYVGKGYMGTAYEVVSMGVQYLPTHVAGPTRMRQGPLMDEDYMNFMFGVMTTVYR